MFNRYVSPWLELTDDAKYQATVDRVAKLGASAMAGCHTPVISRSHVGAALEITRRSPRRRTCRPSPTRKCSTRSNWRCSPPSEATTDAPVPTAPTRPRPRHRDRIGDVADVVMGTGDASRLDVRLLGPVEVSLDGALVELGGPQPRAVIAHLALDLGRVVPVERLIGKLWGEQPPASPLSSVHTTLSRLRRLLEPDRGAGKAPSVIVSEPPGYVLRLPRDAVDVVRFRDLALDGRRASAAALHGQALARFDAALGVWRGPALSGIGPDDVVAPIALGLEEERLAIVEDRFDAELALGRHAEAVAELSSAVADHPLRERLWSTLAIALYRSQRQADALAGDRTGPPHPDRRARARPRPRTA